MRWSHGGALTAEMVGCLECRVPARAAGRGFVACVILASSQGNGARTGRVIVGPLSWARQDPSGNNVREVRAGVGEGRNRPKPRSTFSTVLGQLYQSITCLVCYRTLLIPSFPWSHATTLEPHDTLITTRRASSSRAEKEWHSGQAKVHIHHGFPVSEGNCLAGDADLADATRATTDARHR